jgi:hypothetical protein
MRGAWQRFMCSLGRHLGHVASGWDAERIHCFVWHQCDYCGAQAGKEEMSFTRDRSV